MLLIYVNEVPICACAERLRETVQLMTGFDQITKDNEVNEHFLKPQLAYGLT